ncbi:MAG: tRNA dihydrouridine(20/20a) synthase DusA, partial [Planktothrix sp.]
GQPGSKAWKRYISENAHLTNAGIEVLQQALKQVPL